MIAQIKHPWKPRCRVALLVPQPFFGLCAYQVLHTALDRRMLDFTCRHQPKQGPCRLRGRGGRPFISVVVESIARRILTPATVRILDRKQPFSGFPNHWILMVDAGGIERAQYRPGAVDVIQPPATVP